MQNAILSRSDSIPYPDPEAVAMVDFWTDAGPARWFAKDPAFDTRFRDRFLPSHRLAARGGLDHWTETATGALALILLLDQFPRNAFRGTELMYAAGSRARETAREVIAAGLDLEVTLDVRPFIYLPFGHSEDPEDQDYSVELIRPLGEPHHTRARHHRDLVHRFGRFPHRNAILGRASTAEELRFLAEGGYSG